MATLPESLPTGGSVADWQEVEELNSRELVAVLEEKTFLVFWSILLLTTELAIICTVSELCY